MSSPLSVPSLMDAESVGSDAVSLLSTGTDKAIQVYYLPEDTEGNKMFALGDGDFDIYVNGMIFHTHKYLLKRFNVLKSLIEQQSAEQESGRLSLEHKATDFFNTFKILCSSPIEDMPHFDVTTLVSALRIATTYDYPALRTFAVKKLECAQLNAIERIRIARDFSLTSWEAPAYEELCVRDEPITEEEAGVLGINAFVQVARIRESEQRRKGQEDNAYRHANLDAANERPKATVTDELDSNQKTAEPNNLEETSSKSTQEWGPQLAGSGQGEETLVDGTTDEKNKGNENVNLTFKPSFVEKSSTKSYASLSTYSSFRNMLRYKIPGCGCPHKCAISPCAADALEQLQASQITQATSIIQLESTVQNIKSSLTFPEPMITMEESISPGKETPTLVWAEIQKWLAKKRSGQID